MRRLTIPAALLFALTTFAAGCGGGASKPKTSQRKGTPGQSFTVTVSRPTGGTISSGSDGLISCGTSTAACTANFAWGAVVTLTATADTGFGFEGFAGDCMGDSCTLDTSKNKSDKYVVGSFRPGNLPIRHGNWTDPTVHGAYYRSFLVWKASGAPTPPAGVRDCSNLLCHRPDYEGIGVAPSCNFCHQKEGGALAGWPNLTPAGKNCNNCHLEPGTSMSAAGTYHHVLSADPSLASGSSNTIYPVTTATFTCASCHVMHNVSGFGPTTTANNLRPFGDALPLAGTNGDLALCASCHDVTQTKADGQADDGTLATPIIDPVAFGSSAHSYAVAGRFARDQSTFSVACVKCHNSTATSQFQDGVFDFALHDSTDRRLRAALGRAAVGDDDSSGFCFRCHSNRADNLPGAVKAADGSDWYGVATGMPAHATNVYAQMQKGSGAKSPGPVATQNLFFKPSGEETVSATVTGLAALSDPFTYSASTLYLSSSTNASSPTGFFLASSYTTGVSTSTLYFQSTTATGALPSSVPQSGDAIANTSQGLRDMGAVNASATQQNTVSLSSTSMSQRFFHVGSFISPPVSASSIQAGNWSVSYNARKTGTGNNNNAITAYTRYYIYVWTNAGVKVPVAGPTNETTAITNSNANRTIAINGLAALNLNVGDRLVVDVEAAVTNSVSGGSLQYNIAGTSYTDNLTVPGTQSLSFQSTSTYNNTTFRNTVLGASPGTGAYTNRNSNTTAGIIAWDRVSQFTAPAVAQPYTLAGGSTVSLTMRTSQTAAANGCYLQFAAYRWTAAGAQSQLIGFNNNGESGAPTQLAMPTTAGNQTIALTTAADVAFAAGDQLVVEVQVFKNPTATANNACTVAYGGTEQSNLAIVNANGTSPSFNGSMSGTTWASRSMSPGFAAGVDQALGGAESAGAGVRQLWKRGSFVSPPVRTATTLAAAPWALNVYTAESNANANASARYRIYTWTAANAFGSDIVPWTTDGQVVSTTPTLQAIPTPAGAATTLNAGDRIVVELEFETNAIAPGSSTNTYTFGATSRSGVVLPSPVEFTYPEVSTPTWGRHDVASYSGRHLPNPAEETGAYLAANKHVGCEDCHNPHAAGKTLHVQGSNAIGADGPLKGVAGVQPTFPGSGFATVSGATLNFQGTNEPVTGLTVPQTGDVTVNSNSQELRDMFTTAAASVVNESVSISALGTNANYQVTSFVSPPVASPTTISAGTWTLGYNGRKSGTGNNNSAVTAYTRYYVYVWHADNTLTAVAGPTIDGTALTNSNTNRTITVAGIPAISLAANDRIVVDFEGQVTNTVTGGNLQYNFGSGYTGSSLVMPSSASFTMPTPPPAFVTATSYAPVTAAAEYQICFKCHSGNNPGVATWNAAWTDLAQAFNPANPSSHPVMAALGSAGSGSTTLAQAQLQGGWSPGQTMYCSDCHGNDDTSGAAAQGPHASAAKFILSGPNTAWPSQSDGTTRWNLGNRTTAQGTAAGLFCLNCHPISNTNTAHGESHHNSYACTACHVLIPHGGKIARLIITRSALTNGYAAYVDSNLNTGSTMMTSFTKASGPNNYNENSNCGCPSHHSSYTTGQSW